MGIFRPQKYIFMSIKLFTIFSIKCYEESHKINEWKFSCDTTIKKIYPTDLLYHLPPNLINIGFANCNRL